MIIDRIELSFEACSEAPMYRDPWPSDIFVDFSVVTESNAAFPPSGRCLAA